MRNFAAAIFALIVCVPANAQTVFSPPVPYITGTFTPTFTFATPGDLSVVYTIQTGEYTVTNNQVCFAAEVAFTPTYTTASGVGRFSVPFTEGAIASPVNVLQLTNSTAWPALTTTIVGAVANSAAYIQINGQGSTVNAAPLTITNYVSGTAYRFRFSGCYFTS